ncbi:intimin [Escherichia coli]|uniref:Intimin n=1 Tax=Escherichia coli TaxID=562 RepID=A0A376UGK2_ECOLX|nr:intimin [Escherichia coli]
MIAHYASQGGQIQHGGSQSAQDYQAILPAYVQGGSNIYKVTARAYDRNGNSSNNVQLTITVLTEWAGCGPGWGNGLYG